MDFQCLIESIRQIHEDLTLQSVRAVNVCLSLRNWLIGCYIQEYEQCGQDRAIYGEGLLEKLAHTLKEQGVARCDARELRRYRLLYAIYPQIRDAVTPELKAKLLSISHSGGSDSQMLSNIQVDGMTLVTKLSFTHIAELIRIEDATKRAFYEVECLRSNWSVRELKRQIASLYYERSGLSHNKQKLAQMAHSNAEVNTPRLNIRDPYIFEFLGLKSTEVMSESSLEDQLIDKMEHFLLELGHCFCFEARQKRILIGDEHFFIDLVFYHRILKCHILVELKVEPFTHENIGQLNTYLNWYKHNMLIEGDNPPIGILLCTDKSHALVEYALADMDNDLFVSKYMLELPKKEEMQAFITKEIHFVIEAKMDFSLSTRDSTP